MGKSEKIECAIPSAGQRDVVAAMEQLADEVLPDGFGTEWTGVTYQQQRAGNLAPIVFALSLVLVFLVLSAQYENWAMPVMVLLGVSLGLLGGKRPIHATGQGRCGVERGHGYPMPTHYSAGRGERGVGDGPGAVAISPELGHERIEAAGAVALEPAADGLGGHAGTGQARDGVHGPHRYCRGGPLYASG